MSKRAQSSIEFTMGFIITVLFIVLTCNLFVWFNHCLVQRQRAYEDSRVRAGSSVNPGGPNSYIPPRLNIFSSGGR